MATVITKAQAAAKVAFYLDLEEKVAAGQSVQHGDRNLTRADAGWISARLQHWTGIHDELAAAEKGQNRRVAFGSWNAT